MAPSVKKPASYEDPDSEVLSPSTAALDRTKKLTAYAREQVPHLDGDTYRIVMTAGGDDKVRAEPFDAIELGLAVLWAR